MSRIGQAIGGGGAAVAAFLLLIGGPNWNPSFDNPFWGNPDDDGPTTSVPSDDPSEEPSDDPGDNPGSCDQRQGVIDAVVNMGFDRNDFVVGASAVDWDSLPGTHTDRAFSSAPLTSWPEVRDFLLSDTIKSSALDGVTDDGRISSEDGRWIAVQFQVPIIYDGNNYWDGNEDVTDGRQRVPAGDVWWLNVERSGCGVNPADSLRAVCGNPGFFTLEPARRD